MFENNSKKMKIKNYYYELQIRNKKELIYLTRIEAENLMVGLVENPGRKFVIIPITESDKQIKVLIGTSDIVSIVPEERWYSCIEKIELTEGEEIIHKIYLEKVEKSKTKLLQ